MTTLVADLPSRTAAVAGRAARGDDEAIERRSRGKLPVRVRVDLFLDPGSPFLGRIRRARFPLFEYLGLHDPS